MERQKSGIPHGLISSAFIGLVILIIIILVRFVANAYIQRVVIGIGINLILVVALNLINGYTGVFSLGHIGFMAIGAYTAAILTLPVAQKKTNLPDLPGFLANVELGFLPATIIAGLFAMIIAVLVGYSLMRLSGPYVGVATMGFLIITRVVLINWDTITLGAKTFSGVPQYSDIWWVTGWAIFTIYIVWRIVHSSFGRRMIAVRDNEIAAQSLGISILSARLLAFAISAFFTAVAGSLWAHFIMSFSPKSFYFAETFSVITMLVVGGMGSVSGSVMGVGLISILSEILRNAERGANLGFMQIPPLYGASQLLMAVLFILVMIFRPTGLMGGKEFSFNWLHRLFEPKKEKRR